MGSPDGAPGAAEPGTRRFEEWHHKRDMKHPTVTAAATEMEGVSLYTLANADKMVVKIFNYGGIIQSISFPDSRGQSAEVTLGFAEPGRLRGLQPGSVRR